MRLFGKRIAVLAGDGFEQVELTVPRTALRAAGARVDVVSLREGKLRGMNLHLPGRKVRVDATLREASVSEYDGLLIPGGFIGPDLLRQSEEARAFVRAFALSGKPIASICHGPFLLVSAGLVPGKRLTSWPALRDDIVNAGGIWLDRAVVRDGGLVTSRGPQDLPAFVAATIDLFAGVAPDVEIATTSDPPRAEPPAWAIAPMAAITLPRVLAGAAVAGAAVFALRRVL